MTSSLVGSEMCIRDRSATQGRVPCAGPTPAPQGVWKSGQDPGWSAGIAACLLYTSDAADDM
eukprot:10474089-Prorocentrum_lima.AAC.1